MLAEGLALLAGTDLTSIDEIDSSIARFGDRYLGRVRPGGELAERAAEPAARSAWLAGRLAAEEAVVEALATGEALDWRSVEVVRDAASKPVASPG